MKKKCITAFMLLSTFFLFSQSLIRTSVQEIITSITYVNSLFPRLEGSPSESAVVSYITEELSSAGVDFSVQYFDDMENSHSFSRIIEADIPGVSSETLVIVIPLNHPRNAKIESDGSVNIGLGLGIAREYSKRKLPISLKIIFLGAEFGTTDDYPLGTRQYLSTFFPESNHIFVYLNLAEIPSRLLIRSGGKGIVGPYWLIERTRKALDESGIYYLLKGNENQLYRLNLWGTPTLINDYLQMGYPAVSIEGSYDDERVNVSEWFYGVFSFIDNLVMQNSTGFIDEWDKHYLFFQVFSLSFIIPEHLLLVIFFLGITLPLAYPFIATKRFKRYLRSLIRNFWDIPFLFILIFIFLLAGTGLVYMLMYFRGSPVLWEKYPLYFFLIKISITLVLFSFTFGVLRKIPFSRNSTFYSSSALLLILVNIFILTSQDISLSYYLLWALFFSFLFTLSRNKWLKIVFLLTGLVFLIKLLIDIFFASALPIIRFLLLSPFLGNMFLASNIIPFLFMLIRIDFLFRHKAIARQKVFVRSFGAAVGTVTIIMLLYLLQSQPYSEKNPQPVIVHEFRNLNSDETEIRITSEAPFENLLLGIKELGYPIVSGLKEYKTVVYSYDQPINLNASVLTFLGRESIQLVIDSDRIIETIAISFSISDPIIYDSNFPYTLSPASRTAVLHIGKSPPNPLVIELTVPAHELEDIFIYGEMASEPTDSILVTGKNISVTVRKIFSYKFDIHNL